MEADRFESKIERVPESGCWVWTAALNSYGYGQFKKNGSMRGAHRISYEKSVGPIPVGLVLDHLCRNRCCVNPHHLEPVTIAENVARGSRGILKTHCVNGHLRSDDNIYIRPGNPHRDCLICKRAAAKAVSKCNRTICN